jgi:hypothetical protein
MQPSLVKKATTLSGYLLTPILSILAIGFYDKAQAIDFVPSRDDICNKFTGDVFCVFDKSVIDISADWKYSGGLAKGTSPANTFWEQKSFLFTAKGNRLYEIIDNSYQISFRGDFNKGLLNTDLEGSLVDFNDNRTNGGESIPSFWRTGIGYQVPAEFKVFKYSRDYEVKKTVLNRGVLGCPPDSDVKRCTYRQTYLAGGATSIGGTIEAFGDISLIKTAREAITINAAYSRNLNLFIDNSLAFSIGKAIGNTKTTLDQDDSNSGLTPTNLDLKGEVALGVGRLKNVDFKGSAGAAGKFIWNSDDELASVFATYQEQGFSEFVNAGAGKKFQLSLSDSIALQAGVKLTNATSASVFTQLDFAGPESSAFTVFQVERESVPGPLPILGLGAFFGYSRKLRKRLKASKTPKVKNPIC